MGQGCRMEVRYGVGTHCGADNHYRSLLDRVRNRGGLLVDWLWFSALGYFEVFRTIIETKVALFLAVFAASAALLWLNGYLAYRFAATGASPSPRVSLGIDK